MTMINVPLIVVLSASIVCAGYIAIAGLLGLCGRCFDRQGLGVFAGRLVIGSIWTAVATAAAITLWVLSYSLGFERAATYVGLVVMTVFPVVPLLAPVAYALAKFESPDEDAASRHENRKAAL